jgi:hypothetical protein
VKFVERLLMREEIDSLELDLSRARDISDDGAIAEIGARIAHLEAALANACRRSPKDLAPIYHVTR